MIQETIESGITEGVAPSMAWAVRIRGHWRRGVAGAAAHDSMCDLASLTKVLCTTHLAMQDFGKGLNLEARVQEFLPSFAGPGKEQVTIRHLLTHESGLPAFDPDFAWLTSADEVVAAILGKDLHSAPGESTVYSDLGMILLGLILAGDSSLDQRFAALRFLDLKFSPHLDEVARCLPTEPVEPWRESLRKKRGTDSERRRSIETIGGVRYTTGEVHDPTAFAMGGVAGHAGLFGSIRAFEPWVETHLEGDPVVRKLFTTRCSGRSSRALGWDTIETGGACWPDWGPRTYGHTGFTGTSLWIDPDADLAAVLLTNRVHPTASNMKIREFRQRFHAAVWQEARR